MRATFVLGWLLLACPSIDTLSRGDACELTSDCDAPLVCRLGRCRIECAVKRDCGARLQCLVDDRGLGACQLPEELRCVLSSDCPEGLVCGQGRCVNECRATEDCLDGALCVDADTGTSCEGSGCVCRDPAPLSCLYNGDCRDGDDPARWLACIGGTCRPECFSHRDCTTFNCLPLADDLREALDLPSAGYCGPESECERWYVRAGAEDLGVGGWEHASGDLAEVLACAGGLAGCPVVGAQGGSCQEVWVAQGSYEATESFVVPSGVALYGGFRGDELSLARREGEATILTSASGRVVDLPEGSLATRLDRLTIRGGVASGTGAEGAGGGVRVGADSTGIVLRELMFEDNEAVGGGGLSLLNGTSATVEGCTFQNNRAPSQGGGAIDVVDAAVRVTDSSFVMNSGNGAGALNAISGAEVELLRCVFENNSASTLGGAMRVGATTEAALATIVSSSFFNNEAATGGAIHVANGQSELHFTNVIALGNRASVSGGALSLADGARAFVSVSTIAQNGAQTEGGGAVIVAPASIEMSNSIVWANTAPTFPQLAGDTAEVRFCAVEGLMTGEGNVANGVAFEDAAGGSDEGLTQAMGSTGLGAGNVDLLGADVLDVDGDGDSTEPLPLDRLGQARLRDGALDLGGVQRQ